MSQQVERIQANRVYELSYESRDLGYGTESDELRAYWTGEMNPWGKWTWEPVDGSNTLYLFRDEFRAGHVG